MDGIVVERPMYFRHALSDTIVDGGTNIMGAPAAKPSGGARYVLRL